MLNKRNKEDLEENPDYLGNIWGWKFSYISLAIIVVASIIALPRSCQYKESNTEAEQIEITE